MRWSRSITCADDMVPKNIEAAERNKACCRARFARPGCGISRYMTIRMSPKTTGDRVSTRAALGGRLSCPVALAADPLALRSRSARL